MASLQSFRAQLTSLRRLSQPYFLPYTPNNGWLFPLLLLALLFCVAGTVLGLLSGLMALLAALWPQLTAQYLGGVQGALQFLWTAPLGKLPAIGPFHEGLQLLPWGQLILVMFVLGLGCFYICRSRLRQRRWIPWLLLGIIILMLLSVNGINAGITFIARDLTNALIARNPELSYRNLWVYGICFLAALPIRTFQYYFTAKLSLLWRDWLTKSLISDYLKDRAYYVLNPNDGSGGDVDNPDQRIADDTKDFTVEALRFALDIFDSILMFSLNIAILWSISGELTVALLLYSATVSALMVIAGRRLVAINSDQLRYEADFRYGLVHIRNNSESIAFYSGEPEESREVGRRFGTVIQNFDLLIIWQALLRMVQRSGIYGSNFIPYLILITPILAGDMDYGSFSQANIAFSLVENSLFFIIYNIESLARFSASVGRLEGFQSNISHIDRDEYQDFFSEVAPSNSIVLKGAAVKAPFSNRRLVNNLDLSVSSSQRLLVVGPSGCGKTSLLRVISGLWASPTGEVETPPAGDLLFIPQRPYMTLGSLREQLCYPQDPQRFSNDHLSSVLNQVQLSELLRRYPDFEIKQDWPRLLSLGEQQRLAFARLLLNAPRFVVLDEATSALDVGTEKLLYQLLVHREIAFVSVGHRPTLKDFHDSVLELDGHGGWKLMSAANYSF
jgi:vitamin B12/bleomycin/antimicrobial peptide transport system ATP-binding/permease protein